MSRARIGWYAHATNTCRSIGALADDERQAIAAYLKALVRLRSERANLTTTLPGGRGGNSRAD